MHREIDNAVRKAPVPALGEELKVMTAVLQLDPRKANMTHDKSSAHIVLSDSELGEDLPEETRKTAGLHLPNGRKRIDYWDFGAEKSCQNPSCGSIRNNSEDGFKIFSSERSKFSQIYVRPKRKWIHLAELSEEDVQLFLQQGLEIGPVVTRKV